MPIRLATTFPNWTAGQPEASECSASTMSATTVGPMQLAPAVLQRLAGPAGRPFAAGQAGGTTTQRSGCDHRRLADVGQGAGTGSRAQSRAHRRVTLGPTSPGGYQTQSQRPADATDQGQRRCNPGSWFPAYLRPLSKPTLEKLNALRIRFDLPPWKAWTMP